MATGTRRFAVRLVVAAVRDLAGIAWALTQSRKPWP